MFEAAVDGFCGPLAGVGAVEVGKDVGEPLVQGSAVLGEFDQWAWRARPDGFDHGIYRFWSIARSL